MSENDSPPQFTIADMTSKTGSDGPKIGDTKARPSKRKTRATQARTTKEIEDALAEMLTMPSMAFTIAGDEFCANHFLQAGPDLAQKLALTSEHNDPLRRVLERMIDGESIAVLFMGFAMYLLPPMIHHGLIPASDVIAPLFGVPRPEPQPQEGEYPLHAVNDDGAA